MFAGRGVWFCIRHERNFRVHMAVAAYVLDETNHVLPSGQLQTLRQLVTANGRSFSDPVLDANGNEDMDASRRVVFKFRLTDEQMIEQLKNILESSD